MFYQQSRQTQIIRVTYQNNENIVQNKKCMTSYEI